MQIEGHHCLKYKHKISRKYRHWISITADIKGCIKQFMRRSCCKNIWWYDGFWIILKVHKEQKWMCVNCHEYFNYYLLNQGIQKRQRPSCNDSYIFMVIPPQSNKLLYVSIPSMTLYLTHILYVLQIPFKFMLYTVSDFLVTKSCFFSDSSVIKSTCQTYKN